jgi:von Willebrand factor type A domain/Putative Flp pilus-assembly TadE/G-like
MQALDGNEEMIMATQSWFRSGGVRDPRGFALAYLAGMMFVLLALAGLAIDLGRGYQVRVHLSKAVDGAALAAARAIGNGQVGAQAEANKIFNANFPNGFLGVSSVQNPPTMGFSVASDGSNIIDVSSTAVLPTTFMRIAGFKDMTVRSSGQASRRLVDMALVIDKSGSIGSDWPRVQSAATQFVSYFDQSQDRMALIMYSSNTVVFDPISITRGFNRSSLNSHIAAGTSAGYTVTSEGLYRGWDELRRVPSASQSGLRIIVLFTDGSPNSWSGTFGVSPGYAAQGVVNTLDFPEMGGTSSTSDGVNDSSITALTVTLGTPGSPANQSAWSGGTKSSPRSTNIDQHWTTGTPRITGLPTQSYHPNPSSGVPTQFNLVDTSLVGGNRPVGTSPTVRNVNNAARNLVEIIANAVRTDNSGAYPIRIYTIGMGQLLTIPAGASFERGDAFLKRIANDRSSPDFRPGQPEGKYFFAGDASQLNTAFEQIRNQILRLSQ